MKMELEYIEKLVRLVAENKLTELTVEDGEKAVVIKKEKEIIQAQTALYSQMPVMPPVQQICAPKTESISENAKTEKKEDLNKVKISSPMVGTFYKAPSPGTAPFIEVGKSVSTGQVVCIIEAMKLMNEIEAEVSGKVVEICVEDGQPVEYGQTLMILEV
jgi:acetyl-CoA carboxylase biotin carboxyl carrier protein